MWEEGINKENAANYIIAHFSHKKSDFDPVYIINIVEAVTVIKKHYPLSGSYMGFDFDPLEAVFEIYNESSPF